MIASAPSAPKVRLSTWAPLREQFFRMLWVAAFVSNIGTWVQNVGAVALMTQLTASTVLVALLQTAATLPAFLLSLPAGALADLVDRRRLLMFTQAWLAAVALGLGALVVLGFGTPWLLLGFTFLLGVGAALTTPVWVAVMTEVVPAAQLPAAAALNGVSFNLARAVGPALGGLVISYFSVGASFVLNGLSFLAIAWVIVRWRRAPQPNVEMATERLLSAMRGGIRYARFSPPLQVILVRGAAFLFGASALFALLPVVVAQRLRAPASTYSLLLSCMGAGAVLGAVLLPRFNQRFRVDARVNILTGVFTAVVGYLAFASNAWVLGAAMVVAGAAWLLVLNVLSVAVQTAVPRWVLARSISFYLLVTQGATALGSLVWGAAAQRFGLTAGLGAAAVCLGLSLLLAARYALRRGENLDFTAVQHWAEPSTILPLAPSAGPLAVTITYQVAVADQPAFAAIMARIGRIRRREGALSAIRYNDLNEPERLIEYYTYESWEEYQTERRRGINADEAALHAQALQLHRGAAPPLVRLLLAQPS
ncbi:MFS transporter [Hymenobacter sp.]|uniref:MFS transporter n=1 Tax=Hymenobacter sp. TaxID=1898978 RepID=UPI00286D362F|nr:MFS transporter [Hymenobacter sp.]